MKEVILHIGLHKTGSSTIQRALAGYEKNRTKYASFKESENHSIPMYTLFSKKFEDYYVWKNRGLLKAEIKEKKLLYFKVLEKDLINPNIDKLIISGEDISKLSFSEKINLVRFFEGYGYCVKVLALVRNPNSVSISMNSQLAKRGIRSPKFIKVDYKKSLDGFVEALPRSNIRVHDYDKAVKEDDLIKLFEQELSISIGKVHNINKKTSLQALHLIYKFNNLSINTLGSIPKTNVRRFIINIIENIFSVENGCDSLNQVNFGYFLDSTIELDINWLRKNFDISYKVETSFDRASDIKNNMDECLSMHGEKVSRLYKKLNFNIDKSIEWNLENTFCDMCEAEIEKENSNFIKYLAFKLCQGDQSSSLLDAYNLMKISQRSNPESMIIKEKLKQLFDKLN